MIVFVVGLPGSGKTTLACALAKYFGKSHCSVGDLIRQRHLGSKEQYPELDNAWRGLTPFPADFLQGLLEEALARLSGLLVFVDAGTGIEHLVHTAYGQKVVILELVTDDATRALRFERRRSQHLGSRPDDVWSLFLQRSTLAKQKLGNGLSTLSHKISNYRINALVSEVQVLVQAVSCVLRELAIANRSALEWSPAEWNEPRALDDNLRQFVSLPREESRSHSEWVVRRAPMIGNQFLLLIKPNKDRSASTVSKVSALAREYGYEITRIGLYDGHYLGTSGIAKSHLDHHFIFANLSSPQILDFLQSIGTEEIHHLRRQSEEVYSGAAALEEFGVQRLRRHLLLAWQQKKVVKVFSGLWLSGSTDAIPCTVVNAHAPLVLKDFEMGGSRSVAIHLASIGQNSSAPWKDMRRDFLGSTDPERAPNTSLRGFARLGQVPCNGKPSTLRNGFHLSSGPLESLRELSLWFHLPPEAFKHLASGVSDNLRPKDGCFDQPVGGRQISWLYALTDCYDLPIQYKTEAGSNDGGR